MKGKKRKKTSLILGLPFSLIIFGAVIVMLFNGFSSLKYEHLDETIIFFVSAAVLLLLGILYIGMLKSSLRRKGAGVTMTITGALFSVFMLLCTCAIVYEIGGDDDALKNGAGLGLACMVFMIVASVLLFIGGINSVRTARQIKQTTPWVISHKKPTDFLKNGLAASDDVIVDNYSSAFYDNKNLNCFEVFFPDAAVLYRQKGVFRIDDRLFVAANDLSGNTDSELVFFFEVLTDNGKEKLDPIVGGTEEHVALTSKYYALSGGGVNPAARKGVKSQEISEKSQTAELTREKISEKARKVIMIIIFALYGATLILGILTATTGMLDNAFASTVKGATKETGRAYGITMGLAWVTALPSVGYYIAFSSPIKLSKRSKFFVAAASVIMSAALDVMFFAVTGKYRALLDTNDKWFLPFTVIAGSVCSFVCYLLTILKTKSSAMKEIGGKSLKESNGLFEVIRAVIVGIVNFLLKVCALILYFKDAYTAVYSLIAAILFTLLLPFTTFVAAFVIATLAVCTFALFLSGFISYSYDKTAAYNAYSVYENGYERILTYYSYDTNGARNVYRDDIGNFWYSEDNGETFYKE